MKYTKIQWCHSTVNPVMGCDGCELWPSASAVRARIVAKLSLSPDPIETTVLARLFWNRTTSQLYRDRETIATAAAGQLQLNKHQRQEFVEVIRRECKCYAGLLGTLRAGHPGHADPFESPEPYAGRMAKAAQWGSPIAAEVLSKCWLTGQPRLIFISDMGDALSSEISFDYLRQEIIGTVRSPLGRRHIWLWLTKRPARMAAFGCWLARFDIRWPDNLVAMTTVTGACSAQRVAELRHVPSKLRGLSLEPLFEPLKLDLRGIDWVIVGGGNDVLAAPFQIEWALDLQKQCQAAGVAFFLKQLGRNPFHRGEAVKLQDRHGGDWMEWPAEWCMREIPKTFRTLAGPQSIVPTITGADLRIDCGPAFVAAGLVGNKGAVEHGHIAIAETLLAAGVDIADPDSNPLPVAVYKTIIEIIEWLVSQRAQFDVCEVIGFAIRDALDLDPNKTGISDEQRAACVDLLLRLALQRALSYEQAVKFMKMVADLRIDCGPAFVAAVRVGNKTVVELMIRAGVDVRVKHDEPFRLAVEHGHIAIAKTLLAAGVDIADLDFNPLPMAVYKANIEMIEWLVSQRAQFDVCDVVEFAVRDAVDLDPNKTGISDEQRAACVDLVLRLAFQRALSREQAKKVMNIVAEYAPAKAAQWMAECMDFLPPPPPIGMKNRG